MACHQDCEPEGWELLVSEVRGRGVKYVELVAIAVLEKEEEDEGGRENIRSDVDM